MKYCDYCKKEIQSSWDKKRFCNKECRLNYYRYSSSFTGLIRATKDNYLIRKKIILDAPKSQYYKGLNANEMNFFIGTDFNDIEDIHFGKLILGIVPDGILFKENKIIAIELCDTTDGIKTINKYKNIPKLFDELWVFTKEKIEISDIDFIEVKIYNE